MRLALLALLAALPVLPACSGGSAAEDSEDDPASSALVGADIKFDLIHTRPECTHEGKASTWCDHNDAARLAELSGMETRVKALIDRATDPAKAKIAIAYFSFSNRAVYNKLCEKGKAGFSIEGFFDQSYRSGLPAQLANECQAPGKKNVVVHFLGQLSNSPYIWRLHHNKFLYVDPGGATDRLSLTFSSGNLSSFGLSAHLDHWVIMDAPRNADVAKQNRCVMEGMRAAVAPASAGGADKEIDDPGVYRSKLEDCLKKAKSYWKPGTSWVETAIAKEKVAPLFAPNPAGDLENVLIAQINRVQSGGKIYGAMQHFLHYGIASALQQAKQRGVEVSLAMDDDVITGDSEVEGVRSFYDSYLDPEHTGMKVRFVVTNAGDHQMMHNKFLVMEGIDGQKTRVFSGAGHFTDAGMRDNYENFYLTESSELSAKYKNLFEYIWPKTKSQSDIEQATPATPEAPPQNQ